MTKSFKATKQASAEIIYDIIDAKRSRKTISFLKLEYVMFCFADNHP
jgi:hypothetical protein